MSDTMYLDVFRTSKWAAINISVSYVGGKYSRLTLWCRIDRESKFYFEVTFVPTFSLVIVSYLSFWIKDKTSKYSVAVTVLLASGAFFFYLNMIIPMTWYTKFVDYWTRTCISFMISTPILLVLLENLKRDKPEEESGKSLVDRNKEASTQIRSILRVFK